MMIQSFEPGSSGVVVYIAQGVIALFVLLLLALFVRTAVVVSTLVWLPFVQRFGRTKGDTSDAEHDSSVPPS